MNQIVRPSSFVPAGFIVDEARGDEASINITIRSSSTTGTCPSCGTVSRRVHSPDLACEHIDDKLG